MKSNLAHKQEEDNVITLHPSTVKKKERQAMSDSLSKGFIMKSRLYHYEVEPFLTDAAKNVYSAIMGYTNGFNKPSDHISHRQLQGGKLKGSNKLSSATVSSGLKELIWFEVVSVVEKNNKIGNKYQINEVSLVEYFEQFSALEIKALRFNNESASISKALQLVKQPALVSKAQGALVSSASIEFLFIDSFRYILNNSLRSNRPLENHFFVFQEEKKQAQAEQQKLEAEEKAKAKKLLYENINSIFEFWKLTLKKPKTVLSDIRKSKIEARLKQGYSVDDIKIAILNCSKSEFHVAGNHTDIELICRNEQKLDHFISMNAQAQKPTQAIDDRNVNQAWSNQQTHYEQVDQFELEEWML